MTYLNEVDFVWLIIVNDNKMMQMLSFENGDSCNLLAKVKFT